jgi:SAM-dependent methyltransferase
MIRTYHKDISALSIADIGCGTGALTKELTQYGSCIGIDVSTEAIEFCRSRGIKELQIGSAENTGCENDSFDVVVCLDVLEHLKDDSRGIQEIKRILKPDGIAIIFVPAFLFLWSVTDEVSHHYRRYRLPEIRSKFTKENLVPLRQTYFNTLLFPLIAGIRLMVRLLRLHPKTETETGHGIVNMFLSKIFSLERIILRRMNFPFGVSIMLIVKK